MSTSLTLRRADPDFINALSEDECVTFALCQDDTSDENSIQFFAPWHIVHFISSGTEWEMTLPAGFMIGGKYWVSVHPDEEPFRLLSADEVEAVDKHLNDLPKNLVEARLEMLSLDTSPIYGGPVHAEVSDQVIKVFGVIKQFFKDAAEKGQAVTKAMS